MQRTFDLEAKWHVGLIMDGNGRWAEGRGLPRGVGHEAGVATVRRVARAAPGEGIGTLTLYAFSADNWRRPPAEVAGLMGLLRLYLAREVEHLRRDGARLTVIGRRDRLPDGLPEAIAAAEAATRDGARLHLRIALDYSARDAILAAARLAGPAATREEFGRLVAPDGAPEVDLVIRTGGEQRLCRTALHPLPLAGFRRGGAGRGDGGVPCPPAPLRRAAGGGVRRGRRDGCSFSDVRAFRPAAAEGGPTGSSEPCASGRPSCRSGRRPGPRFRPAGRSRCPIRPRRAGPC